MKSIIISALLLLSLSGLTYCAQYDCGFYIAESTPDKLVFNNPIDFKPRPTHETLISIINNSSETLKIASFYWTLTAEDEFANHPSTLPGKQIMDAIELAVKRGVKLEVILDQSSRKSMNNEKDVERLNKWGTVKYLNMTRLLKAGVLHTKFLIADSSHLYLGSSNFDWRSYLQIKEIGITFVSCSPIAQDLDKVFRTYAYISDLGKIPEELPDELKTKFNEDNPFNMHLTDNGRGQNVTIYIGSSPPAFNGIKKWTGRTDDIDGLLSLVEQAEHSIDISVMNYSPRTEFMWPKKFWPRIDNALRQAAAERRVRVRLLFSDWSHAKEEEIMWYRSLNAIQSKALSGGSIHVKMFKVPAFDDFQKKIPYARVKHDKFMVTDNGLYIGTSNWTPDYFINTGGVSVVIQPKSDILNGTVIKNMQDLFERDFTSEFSHEL